MRARRDRNRTGCLRRLSAEWYSPIDGFGDGDGEVDDLSRFVAYPGDVMEVRSWRHGDGLGSSRNHTTRSSHCEGKGVAAS